MKKFKIITVLAIAFCFLLGTTTVYGADGDYSLTVSGGNGTIAGDIPTDATAVTVTTGTNGKVTVNGEDHAVTPPDSKYFVRGLKLAGHDNDELFTSIDVNKRQQDEEVVVAYGLKSNMVKYTISYVDQNNRELAASDTHYGVIGDKPTVSFKYVEGYLPQAYDVTKTLTDNPADNVLVFTYTQAQTAEGQTIINNTGNANAAAGGNAAAGNAAAGNAAGNAAAAPGTTIGENATPLAVDDQDTPLAANPEEEGGGSSLPYIIGGIIAAGIIAAIAAVLARRRGEEAEEEE